MVRIPDLGVVDRSSVVARPFLGRPPAFFMLGDLHEISIGARCETFHGTQGRRRYMARKGNDAAWHAGTTTRSTGAGRTVIYDVKGTELNRRTERAIQPAGGAGMRAAGSVSTA